MQIIKYQLMTEVNHGTEEEPNIVQTFNACEIRCNDSNFEANYALAKAEAYNGEVTVEEVADEEPEPTPEERISALEEENSMLRAQISAQSDQMDFYEDCIAEMAMVVYA